MERHTNDCFVCIKNANINKEEDPACYEIVLVVKGKPLYLHKHCFLDLVNAIFGIALSGIETSKKVKGEKR